MGFILTGLMYSIIIFIIICVFIWIVTILAKFLPEPKPETEEEKEERIKREEEQNRELVKTMAYIEISKKIFKRQEKKPDSLYDMMEINLTNNTSQIKLSKKMFSNLIILILQNIYSTYIIQNLQQEKPGIVTISLKKEKKIMKIITTENKKNKICG